MAEVRSENPHGGNIGNKEADARSLLGSEKPSPLPGSNLPMNYRRADSDDDPEIQAENEKLLQLHEELRPAFKITKK